MSPHCFLLQLSGHGMGISMPELGIELSKPEIAAAIGADWSDERHRT